MLLPTSHSDLQAFKAAVTAEWAQGLFHLWHVVLCSSIGSLTGSPEFYLLENIFVPPFLQLKAPKVASSKGKTVKRSSHTQAAQPDDRNCSIKQVPHQTETMEYDSNKEAAIIT